MQTRRAYIIAWAMALLFYVLEYATRSTPAVMIPQLEQAFARPSVGVSSILGSYYYTYSLTSLVAGLALDRAGAKYVVPLGACILGVGCLLFIVESAPTAYLARLLQGAGSAFAFTGAVYLAARGFSAGALATAIGVTQSLGMLGGSAGQFVVGPLMQGSFDWRLVWSTIGVASLLVALVLLAITPTGVPATGVAPAPASLLGPYRIVLGNTQSYLCGLIAGLLFAPTTIGAMTWGVAFLQIDRNFSYQTAVLLAATVPLGWAVGCPAVGWLADRVGLRKPVLAAGAIVMLLAIAQLTLAPGMLPPGLTPLILGVASGAAMIPYTIIKEANPDEAKGSATGAINFINFGVTSLLGPVFATLFGRSLDSGGDPAAHFRSAGDFWLLAVALAILLMFFLGETGRRHLTAPSGDSHLRINRRML